MSRAYLREISVHLVVVLGSVTILVSLGAAVRASATSQGAPLWIPMALIPLIVGNALPYLIPATLLTAVVITYGRMSADGEATALRAAGVHPLRIMLPALLAGGLVAVLSYPLSATVLPELYTKMRELSYRLRFAALENTNPSASELHFGGLHLSWRGRNPDDSFRDVVLSYRERADRGAYAYDPGLNPEEEPASPRRIRVRADRAAMVIRGRDLELELHGMRTFEDRDAEEATAWTARNPGVSYLRIDLESLGTRPPDARKADDFSSRELLRKLRSGELEAEQVPGFQLAFWQRVAAAAAALPLALVGAVLGWRLRRSGLLAAFAAAFAVLLLVFYPLYYLGSGLHHNGALPAAPAALMPVAGLVLVLLLMSLRRRL